MSKYLIMVLIVMLLLLPSCIPAAGAGGVVDDIEEPVISAESEDCSEYIARIEELEKALHDEQEHSLNLEIQLVVAQGGQEGIEPYDGDVLVISADDLYDEFVADPGAALTKYFQSPYLVVEVTGVAIKKYPEFVYFVSYPDEGIECSFILPELYDVSEGDIITVRGELQWFDNGWVRIRNCSLVK